MRGTQLTSSFSNEMGRGTSHEPWIRASKGCASNFCEYTADEATIMQCKVPNHSTSAIVGCDFIEILTVIIVDETLSKMYLYSWRTTEKMLHTILPMYSAFMYY